MSDKPPLHPSAHAQRKGTQLYVILVLSARLANFVTFSFITYDVVMKMFASFERMAEGKSATSFLRVELLKENICVLGTHS